VSSLLLCAGVLPAALMTSSAQAATVGQGFTITPSDLKFILAQIKIAEAHVANTTSATGPCGALVGSGPNQIPSPLVSKGLRTVDGSCNNLVEGQERIGASDELFPRLGSKSFRDAEGAAAGFFGPGSPAVPSSTYKQKKGNVFDSEPRVISNLVVDQTSTNPAAIAAAGFPVRTQGNPGVVPCTTDPDPLADPPVAAAPADCTPSHETLFIPNVTTDVGLSPPYNSLFTLFGQFFDHGVDQTVKSGGTVFVPLKADDPLIAGPDHILANDPGTTRDESADNLPASQRFMVLTRGQNQPGPDGILGDLAATPVDESADDRQDAANTDSPWVDQSQTYTSHPSHQVFLREYENNAAGRPIATGALLGGPRNADGTPGPTTGGMATWTTTKRQAADLLGIQLLDKDVLNVPMLAVDPYGKFIPGPNRGLPQFVTTGHGLVEADRGADSGRGTLVPSDVRYFDTPFLADIAHNADPSPQDLDHDPATPPTAPTPDANTTASADFANQPAGTYDDEMLNAHFIAGDGRVNENIGLTTIHQIFHSEHDRLVGDMQHTIATSTDFSPAQRDEWKLPDGAGPGEWNGERLFQAARFVTEMEYQHLVFEEFARKVQPAINPFEPFAFTQTDLNPAIRAEFAHAVYRFGHSMLTETISRKNADKPGTDQVLNTADDVLGSTNDISLLDGFLNPPEYTDGGAAGPLTSEQAAGSVIMGMSDQVGNELDEFVTDTLRNNLLGLPLDLPTINMTRARSEGIPPLNVLRRELYGSTNDSQLQPYTNWVDFGENLKHPESLINFVAAYGQHPTIRYANAGPDGELVNDPATPADETADNGAATLASRRAAATHIVSPVLGDTVPADADDFMFSTGTWANTGTKSITGLDSVDLWVGGLAEMTNPFGGLLGTTFNYVFENQLTDLQNGDRLYYLARTPGMNLRTQLEGNSFAELMQRNTEGTNTLKADAFATADCKFQLGKLSWPAAPAAGPDGVVGTTDDIDNVIFGAGSVNDEPVSECNENKLLLRQSDGTFQYRAVNKVDPPGINGQSVYNGTPGADRVRGGNDNDTFWGGLGKDVIEGGAGADVALGGEDNDIITDLGGDDVPKGGPGNDAIDAGPGLDILMGGEGKDFTNGGANANETFGGDGDDFIMLGQSLDAAFGDSGDDFEEGGDQPDLMQGDSGNLFFLDDSQKPGSDILIGQGGDDDYDMEGGDDVGLGGPGVEKVAGASGYDWEIGIGDPQAQDMDLAIPLVPLDILQVGVRDKFNEVESLSGGDLNDTLRGDDVVPSQVGGGGFIGCDALDQAGLDRITGLDPLVPPLTTPLADVVAISASRDCPILSGPVWGDGNILLGGGGSDLIEGRGADDIIDGDRYLNVRLLVRNPDGTTAGWATTNQTGQSAMTSPYQRDTAGVLVPGSPTLQQAVFAGTVDPGNIVAVKEIVPKNAATDVDTALFSGPRANYTVTPPAAAATDPVYTVTDNVGTDGTDRLRNVERLRFTDQTVGLGVPAAPSIGAATAGNASATVNWTSSAAIPPITSFTITVRTGETVTQTIPNVAATATSRAVTGLTNGTPYTFTVKAVNAAGTGPESARSNIVTPNGPLAAPTNVVAARAAASGAIAVTWTPPPGTITSYTVQVRLVGLPVNTINNIAGTATGTTVTGLTGGLPYTIAVRAVNATGPGAFGVSNSVTAFTVPNNPPGTPTVAQGPINGALTATVTWNAPLLVGGTPLTGYVVTANRLNAAGLVVSSTDSALLPVGPPRTFTFTSTAPAGTVYRFQVKAVNLVGQSGPSNQSGTVVPR
jgi:Ca2+-binding RTX toxin-like protein